MADEITVIVTSCGRLDLLEPTVSSFLSTNDYPVARYILVDDSGDPALKSELYGRYGGRFEILFNERKAGQIASIDRAYALVNTPFIFHCEDDWRFFRTGYIADSLSVMKTDPWIVTVWLRDLWDTNGHPPERRIYKTTDGVQFRRMARRYASGTGSRRVVSPFHGFSFNPGLRRTADYRLLGDYQRIGHEAEIGKQYFELGYYAAILEEGAVEHIGWGRHIVDPFQSVLSGSARALTRNFAPAQPVPDVNASADLSRRQP